MSGTSLQITPGFEALVRDLGLTDPRRAAEFSRGEAVKTGGSTHVFRFREPTPDGDLYYLKIYRYFSLRPMVKYALRRSRARVEFDSLTWLQAAGLPGVVPVACGTVRTFGLVRSCFLLTRGVEDAESLETYLPRFLSEPHSTAWLKTKGNGIRDLGRLVAQMHAGGFFDGDLFLRNILTVPPAVAGDRLPWWFLDHPKGRLIPEHRPAARQRAAACDLACLDLEARELLSRADRLRFLRDATGIACGTVEGRKFIELVMAQRDRLLEKQASKKKRRSRRQRPKPRRDW